MKIQGTDLAGVDVEALESELKDWYFYSHNHREALEHLSRFTTAWEIGVGMYESDIIIHFDPKINANDLGECMSYIMEDWKPDEARWDNMSLRLWWD